MNQNTNIIVTVIVPAYNYANFIGECLDSVLSQTFKSWECIVIDNGSTDNTQEIVKSYSNNDGRIKYHYTNQKGVSLARNLAVSLSQGTYLLPLDADDKIDPTYLEKAVNIMNQNPEISLVYCNAILFGSVNKKWILPDFNYKAMLIENSIFCSALIKKNEFLAVNGYNVNMVEGFEDWDFWIKYLANNKKVYKLNDILFYYRIKQHSRNSVLDTEKQLRLRTQIYHNHKDIYHQYFSIPELIYQNYTLSTNYNTLHHSFTYKIGKLLTFPYNFIKKIIG
ncbi:MAG: glycosyltransferase family 2 protein [Bacteroidia bacterium]|nr:glycosyltransferase family 2 protein [Bacteroidia bacterium]